MIAIPVLPRTLPTLGMVGKNVLWRGARAVLAVKITRKASRKWRMFKIATPGAQGAKTYHLLVSFRPEDETRLAPEVFQDIERRFAAALGYAEHQRIAAYIGIPPISICTSPTI